MDEKNIYGTGLYNEGIFYFTNPGLYKHRNSAGDDTTDFTTLWNNKEYTFKGKTTTPLVIQGEPPENVQHIRKQFAENYAKAWFFQTKRYQELVKKGGYIPATYVEADEFRDVIQACLTPLPKSTAVIKELPRKADSDYKSTRAVKPGQDLRDAFRDMEIPELGAV